jgi:hypothetical protein
MRGWTVGQVESIEFVGRDFCFGPCLPSRLCKRRGHIVKGRRVRVGDHHERHKKESWYPLVGCPRLGISHRHCGPVQGSAPRATSLSTRHFFRQAVRPWIRPEAPFGYAVSTAARFGARPSPWTPKPNFPPGARSWPGPRPACSAGPWGSPRRPAASSSAATGASPPAAGPPPGLRALSIRQPWETVLLRTLWLPDRFRVPDYRCGHVEALEG